jgi:hypothetical protein
MPRQEDWGDELDEADDWALVEDELTEQSRWCTHWRKVVRHDATGRLILISYARNVGDGDSAEAYPTVWRDGEGYEVTVTKYRPAAPPTD